MITVNKPLFIGRERQYLLECIDSGWISSDGPFVERFENAFANFLGTKYAIAVCNGTVAIELALAAVELNPGDEVIMPAHTIISCPMGVIRRGLTPVLVDVDVRTWCIDVDLIEERITPRTRAIMPVHMFGHPCNMRRINDIARKYGLLVIEDSAEAHGAKCEDRYCGTLGDVAAFSFYANKIITTGEGGMVVTDDERIADKARYYRNLCFQPKQRFWHEDLGYNFRMTNLQAAIGLAQVEKFEDLLKIKREQGALYSKLLRNIKYLRIQQVEPWASHVYWVFGLLIDEDAPFDAKALSDRLLKRGVQTRPFFWPLNEQPALTRMGLFNNEDYPVAQRLGRKGLYVPSGMALGVSEQEEVAEKLRDSVTELCNEK